MNRIIKQLSKIEKNTQKNTLQKIFNSKQLSYKISSQQMHKQNLISEKIMDELISYQNTFSFQNTASILSENHITPLKDYNSGINKDSVHWDNYVYSRQKYNQHIQNAQQDEPQIFQDPAFDSQNIPEFAMEQIETQIQTDKFQSSFLVYDPERMQEVVDEWKEKIEWIQPRYAVKCNPLNCVLQDLNENGFGFDIASMGELAKLQRLNVDPSKIIYANTFKDEKDLKKAYEYGVRLTVADTEGELEKIKRLAPKMKVLWRFSIQEKTEMVGGISFAEKFGDSMNTLAEIKSKFQKMHDKGYKINGVHFHAGSAHSGSKVIQDYLKQATLCMREASKIGHPMEIIDVGGGFAGNGIDEYYKTALETIQEEVVSNGWKVIAEPGRFVSSRLFSLGVRVLGKRIISENQSAIYINDGIYQAFNKLICDGVSLAGLNMFYANKQYYYERGEKTTIFGQSCDGLDVIGRDLTVPSNIKVGDWLIFGGMGAYTSSAKSNFNGMKSCETILVLKNKKQWTEQFAGEMSISHPGQESIHSRDNPKYEQSAQL